MKKLIFFHLVIELIKFKITFAIENAYIFKNNIYAEIRYIRNKERHYIKLKNRFANGVVVFDDKRSSYTGYIPYWIDYSNKAKIYDQEFHRLFGTMYYSFRGTTKGIFIFNKKFEEIFCSRLFKTINFKVIVRLA